MRFVMLIALLLSACKTASPTPDDPASMLCRCEDGCVEACPVDRDERTSYRKVVRDPNSDSEFDTEPPEAFDPIDPTIAALTPEELAAFAADAGIEPAELDAGFRADFVRGSGAEVAIVSNDAVISIYRGSDRVARLELGGNLTGPVRAVQLIDDRAEVVVSYQVEGVDYFVVCRVIGESIARVLELPLEGQTVEFVHLGDERAIRVRELGGAAHVYRWNKWEGMFRIPTKAPTAP